MLLVHGPWHPDAGINGDKPLWHPRCATDRLQVLWSSHERAILAAAGDETPWCELRLWFVTEIGHERSKGEK